MMREYGLNSSRRFLNLLFVLALLCCPVESVAATDMSYETVTGPCDLAFPRDHADHPAYRTEWWYYTGHLKADNDRHFGFQLTFFRHRIAPPAERRRWPEPPSAWRSDQMYLAHAAVTDITAGRHRFAQRIARAAVNLAGTRVVEDLVTVHLNNWSAAIAPTRHCLQADGADFAFELDLTPLKGPILHGHNGYSRKGSQPEQASCYYSFTRLAARGQVTVGGQRLPVRGLAWMDHEFATAPLEPGLAGWDWFSLQLDDNRELMVFGLRRPDGTWHPASSGTLVMPDGSCRHLKNESIRLEVVRRWQSPHTKALYPAGWRLQVDDEALSLKIEPVLDDQEMRTGHSTGVIYWEGGVIITGRSGQRPLKGRGYVEMTGYAGAFEAPL